MEEINNFNILQNIKGDYFETESEGKLMNLSFEFNQNFKDLINIVQQNKK